MAIAGKNSTSTTSGRRPRPAMSLVIIGLLVVALGILS